MKIKHEDYLEGHYHVGADIEKYPEAVWYVVWSYRGPGKTTNALWYMAENNHKFIYMKRTNEDVDLICNKIKMKDINYDVSPFATVNRVAECNVKTISLMEGFGGFYDTNDNGEPFGAPLGYVLSLNKVKSIKGADLSACDFIILDEFIPQAHEIIRHKEGEAFLEFIRTVGRDRIARGLPPVKIILFANSEDISCPITQTLEIIDQMAEVTYSDEPYLYMRSRRILLHHIKTWEAPAMTDTYESDPLLLSMKGTRWAKKSYEGEFANNDFSSVEKVNMKGMTGYLKLHYKNRDYYIYYRDSDGLYYMTFSKVKTDLFYDLNKENDQKAFWGDECQSLRCDCIEGRMKFEKYSMYDLIMNYKKYFKI